MSSAAESNLLARETPSEKEGGSATPVAGIRTREANGAQAGRRDDSPSLLAVHICMPTYNEARSLPATVAAVRASLPASRILVVDDGSPDGTGEVAERIAASDPGVSVLHRAAKEGLGRAYRAGFDRILSETSFDGIVVQMDADGSHPADRLPALVEALRTCDLAVGSRYVAGGATRHWARHRLALSRFGSLYARALLGLPVRDPTSGFKAWRRDLLEAVLREDPRADGYAFQVETVYRAVRLGAAVREVPIIFSERRDGSSKMSLAIAWEACWRVPLLRFGGPRRARARTGMIS